MTESEIIPPHRDDPSEARWRETMRQHAVRMRIFKEEYDREDPPTRYTPPPLSRWERWSLRVGVVCAILAGAVIGWLVSLPPRPIHVVVEQGSTP
jgi:hypothetical protein